MVIVGLNVLKTGGGGGGMLFEYCEWLEYRSLENMCRGMDYFRNTSMSCCWY